MLKIFIIIFLFPFCQVNKSCIEWYLSSSWLASRTMRSLNSRSSPNIVFINYLSAGTELATFLLFFYIFNLSFRYFSAMLIGAWTWRLMMKPQCLQTKVCVLQLVSFPHFRHFLEVFLIFSYSTRCPVDVAIYLR